MIFRYPEMAEAFHLIPVALRAVFWDVEAIILLRGIEPIIYKISIAHTGPVSKDIRRLELQCDPFHYSKKCITEIEQGLHSKYGMEVIVVHRKPFGNVPERVIIEIPQAWVDEPRVFLKKYGYTNKSNHV